MNTDADAARILALEAALARSVEYLRRLPRVPATATLVRELQAVLLDTSPAPRLRSGVMQTYTAAGLAMLRLEVLGPVYDLQVLAAPRHGAELLTHLAAGLRGNLQPLSFHAPLTGLEADLLDAAADQPGRDRAG